ncbi:hypothetical protein [Catellatospora sp. NPDC049609]|uniref:hypothetical protein n=1 Tax=Catellatospora sp. NPDC049609 TaxID=3155505 RepID=UPI003425E1E7
MTGQIADEVRHTGVDYQVVAVAGTGLFDPADHGLTPEPLSTACWRGFHCGYVIKADRLLLDEVTIGLPAEQRKTVLFGRSSKTGRGAHRSAPTYRKLAAPMPFTGRLLLGDEYVRVAHLHMGFLPAWSYVQVVELTFDGGLLAATRDRSAEAARVRELIGAELARPGAGERIEDWVHRTFSLDFGYSLPDSGEERGRADGV